MSSHQASHPLVNAATLRTWQQSRPALVILDVSFELANEALGERQYHAGHLPGARYVHLDRDLSGTKTGHNGRHPLPSREAFCVTVGKLGITPDTPVVVYDRQGAMFAARAWWMLRWIGHPAVAVLDGGIEAWQDAGGSLSSDPPAAVASPWPYPLQPAQVDTVDADTLLQRLGRIPLIDARAPERFRGEIEPLDAEAGHIPGARNRFFKDNLDPQGRFKPAEVLRADFAPLLGRSAANTVVHQCGSGVTACHNLLAMEVAGLHGSTLYPGSWSEWSSDPTRPIAQGG